MEGHRFNPAPGWPAPPAGWTPPPGWTKPASWPDPPPGWNVWVPEDPGDPVQTPESLLESAPVDGPSHTAPPSSDLPVAVPSFPAHETIATKPDVAALEARIATLEAQLVEARDRVDVVELDDERVLQEAGIYRYHHPLENAAAYKHRLSELDSRIANAVKEGQAILANDMFTFNNSLAKGRKMVADFSRLMLRAYNAEAENCVRSLRAGNVLTAKKRLGNAVEAIAKLGSLMEMRVNPEFHHLRIEEIELTADYLVKLQEEKEQAREEREQLREQRRVEAELAAVKERLEKERTHYLNALETLRAAGKDDEAAELETKLSDVDRAIADTDYRAANIRAGYVYVISNPGALGPHMVKIGMTRRLEPLDRVAELGDASVPFPFEVHAMYFSDDAVTLEAELHRSFSERKVNWVNERREFFFASPAEVREVLATKVGNLLHYTDEPEATQFHQSRGQWPSNFLAGPHLPTATVSGGDGEWRGEQVNP